MGNFEKGPNGLNNKEPKEVLHASLSPEELKRVRSVGCTIADYAFLKKAGIIRNIKDLQLLAQQTQSFPQMMEKLRKMPLKDALEYFEKQKGPK